MSQLFIDLSAEEQEVVAGGSAIDFDQDEVSKFKTNYLYAYRNSGTNAGPFGASTYNINEVQKDSLYAKSKLKVKANVPAK
ncbi:hypothetical protein SD80_013375 [Scytonema tolypothrichoides VB-61278]|nr:hypothetical protein SD80_013375 [Scytonema tolypothrichoides VB-61278]